MGMDNERLEVFRHGFCDACEDAGIHLDPIVDALLPDRIEEVAGRWFANEAAVMQYLCAVGVAQNRIYEHTRVARSLFAASTAYMGNTLIDVCERLVCEAVENGLDKPVCVALAALHGVMVTGERPAQAPECHVEAVLKPADPEPKPAPVPAVPECIVKERESVQASIRAEAQAKIRSVLLRRGVKNICCDRVASLVTWAAVNNDGTVTAEAKFVCGVCGKTLAVVKETHRY